MALRKAIVVAANPQDHSVDLVMVDNYSRYTGVQVQSHTASSRTGSIDLPDVLPRENKWDISQPGAQEIQALVDFVGRVPIVTGFIFPQISQMTHDDGKLKYNRHTSDVQTYTDGEGNMGILHPSGAHILLGVDTDPKVKPGANFDKSSAIDRNTDKKVYLRVALAGNVAVLTMDPNGNCSLELKADLTVTCENASVTAKSAIKLKAPQTTIDGKLHVTGEMTTDSSITSKGDQIANGTSTHGHTHTGHGSGNETSGPNG